MLCREKVMSNPDSLEDTVIKSIMNQATPEHLIQLLGNNLDKLLTVLASTTEGKARLLRAVRKKSTECEKHFSDYKLMKMDRATTTGSCPGIMDPKTRIQFLWCPHWGNASTGHHLAVKKDPDPNSEFKKKGIELGFEGDSTGFMVRPNPVDKKRLLNLCKSEGMDPEALTCLDLLMERQWFYSSKRRRRK